VLILLPPSETKMDGGSSALALDLSALSFPQLARSRRSALTGLREISRSVSGSMHALKLGPTQRFEIERNRAISTSAVMPAMDRYTGVLYDALGATTMDAAGREFLARTTVIHSALFGLIGAADPIPAYRFSHNTSIPGTSLGAIWREANGTILRSRDDLVLDLRSESYVHLGPTGGGPNSFFVRVVTEANGGTRRALNHFNKAGKGSLLRALALNGQQFSEVDELLVWADGAGVRLEPGASGELDLVV
jgi:hypothetical protein